MRKLMGPMSLTPVLYKYKLYILVLSHQEVVVSGLLFSLLLGCVQHPWGTS